MKTNLLHPINRNARPAGRLHIAILLWAMLAASAAAPGRAQVAECVEAVGMTVSDMNRALAFYTDVLPFQMVDDVEVAGESYERLTGVFGSRMRVVRLALGDEQIVLTEFLAPKGRPIPVDARSNDRWFQHIAIVVSDMDAAYRLLRAHNVQHASSGPQRIPDWNEAAAGIEAFYFKDPDGHNLEIIYFPPGKGNPRWQQDGGPLFLGIDHTAIVVSDTDRSLAFYRDALGLHVAGSSENYGTEQEHLNNVFGARLRITGLRGVSASGPGVEFLEYLAPTDGRPTPDDVKANDLIHWQTTLIVSDLAALLAKQRRSDYSFVSPGVVDIADNPLGFQRGALVRDPDGHALLLIEK